MEVGLGPGNFVFDGDPAPPEKRAQPLPNFGQCLLGQTAGWMKTPLAAEVYLGPGHIVLDGDQAPPRKGHSSPPPSFSAHVYCGHGRPSQLLLSSCLVWTPLLLPVLHRLLTKSYAVIGKP